ncbi:MAG: N-formylglutamate amidohydrolase [Kofleriaceae bacterium]|nr:N-formylglutamate amidohydrolase [Myxococcales bacterium]MCB9563578.1 N-formylglutamate amidohydrolase [Kofleriaceae bacterium]MCB9574102.1 N-formylglutamate amidohydrolase [Kofleriaceae bacterium]
MIGIVLSCEHASWTLPPGEDLGVSPEVLRSQASWDHGAYEIAARVGEGLGLPVHAGAFSRMLVDLNRPPEHPDVIPAVSYGAPVPGNAGLSAAARAARLARMHAPYWEAVRRDVRARLRDPGRCLHLSSHTFAPELEPERRAFDCGVLYDPAAPFEAALAERLQFGLRAHGLAVRANQPYKGTEPALVTSLRGELAGEGGGYAGIELETSHAVTRSAGGCARVAAAVVAVIEELRERA